MPCLKGVAQVFLLKTVSDTDHFTQTHCADFAITVTKDDGSPVAAAGTLTPRNNGTYLYYATAEEMNCDLLILEGTGTGVDDTLDWFYTEANYSAARAVSLDGIDTLTTLVEGISGGSGSRTVTLTVSDGTNVLAGVRVTVHNSAQTDAGLIQVTNSSGQVVYGLDDGSYKVVVRTSPEYTAANPFTLEVNGTTTQTLTVTPVTIPAPADPAYCTVYCWAQELDGSIPAATFALTAKHSATASGKSVLLGADTATVNVTTGYAALTILRGAVVTLELSSATDRRRRERVVVPAADSVNWEDMGAHA